MSCRWITSSLGDVCEIYQPKTISTKEMVPDGAFPVFGANGMIGRYDKYNHEEPQLLITCRGATCGAVNISAPRSWITGNAMVVRPKTSSLDVRYLEYVFRGGIDIGAVITGAAQPQITRSNLAPTKIVYPSSISEQQRIVGILDEAFGGIAAAKANAEKNFQNARSIFEGALWSAFDTGDVSVPLSDLAEDITDGDHAPPPKAKSGVPFITISDIQKSTRTIDFSNTFYVPREYFNALKPNKKPRKGDVLYTVTGATLGIPVLVNENLEFCFQRHIGLVRPKSDINSAWLNYALLSPQVFRQATTGATGAAQKTVSLAVLRNISVPKATWTEQQAAVAMLDGLAAEVQRLEAIYTRKLAALDELKKSLLHKAFAGEL